MNIASDYLRWLFIDAGRVELRHQHGKRWNSSWHEAPESLIETAQSLEHSGNLFTSLQHTATDKLIDPITNDDIDRYCRILFDFDPERPTDTASTEDELHAARKRTMGLRKHLTALGWSLPAVALSGNGFHLQYRTALPNTSEIREQLRLIYTGLHIRFSDDEVSFDRTVKNPGRIVTLYGTTKRKGYPSEDRPHRCSQIHIPQQWRQVTRRQIDSLANQYAKEQAPRKVIRSGSVNIANGSGDYSSLDVVTWLASHGLYVGHLRANLHGVRCPWSEEHSTPGRHDGGDCIIFEADGGWPGFHCKHSHCADRTIRDVIALLGDADGFCSANFERASA